MPKPSCAGPWISLPRYASTRIAISRLRSSDPADLSTNYERNCPARPRPRSPPQRWPVPWARCRSSPSHQHCVGPRSGPHDRPMTDFSPREIVSELDRFIIGQTDAKRAVAVALRNRWRRLQLDDKLREEVLPKNILMIGPTGVGKTEISRRLARLAGAPFLKVEAT